MSSLRDSPLACGKQRTSLVEFRAGKMAVSGGMVHPDRRKGLVSIYQSEDSLMHFCWKDRATGVVEDDLIIFPDDIEFKHVSQCTTGRVYVLKFKSSSRKFFFWLQEPMADKDEENCWKVNDFLNNPPPPTSPRRSTRDLPSDLPGCGEQNLFQSILGRMNQQQLMELLSEQNLRSILGKMSRQQLIELLCEQNLEGILGRMNQQQLMELLSGMRMRDGSSGSTFVGSLLNRPTSVQSYYSELAAPVEAPSSLPSPVVASCPYTLSPQRTAGSETRDSTSNGHEPASVNFSEMRVDLAKVLEPEAMIPILANPDVQIRLTQFLPDSALLPKTEAELHQSIDSPHFQQVLTSFSAALQSGQLAPLMSQFGLGEDVVNAAAHGDMEAFIRAMQDTRKKKDENDDFMEH
ncbi:hypothetical protein BsWGS_21740 [Bradybaena similaris]